MLIDPKEFLRTMLILACVNGYWAFHVFQHRILLAMAVVASMVLCVWFFMFLMESLGQK